MKRGLRVWVFLVIGAIGAGGHDVYTTPLTFSREISRVLYARCISCHRDGGTAFPLVTYEQARPWAKSIKEEVLERRMPPWGAIKGFGDFRNDQALPQEEIALITDWVEGGAPAGDPALLPKPPAPAPTSARKTTSELVARSGFVLRAPMRLAGIRAGNDVTSGASLMVTAIRPDRTVEPLLWLYGYAPKFARSYWYRSTLLLPAGTRIEAAPAEAGSVALLPAAPSSH
jgi:hypothetical protein